MSKLLKNIAFVSNIIVRNYSPKFPFRNFPKENATSKLEPTVAEYEDDPEGFGDYESDFMDLHKTHKEYEHESSQNREKLQHLIVGRKYFKKKQPNFLTYAEKEQIKLLHARDPEEWTLEKLSESFPADLITISKLIKAKWSARSFKRVEAHDRNVWRNWQLLKDGKLPELDEKLKQHLKRFSNRDLTNQVQKSLGVDIVPIQLPKPKVTEFSSLITSNKEEETDSVNKKDSSKLNQLNMNKNTRPGESETFLLDKIESRKEVRLSDLNLGNFKETECKKNILSAGTKSHDAPTTNFANNFETKEITILEKDVKTYEMTSNRDRIYIPKKVWKRGATYRVEDSYYGDDGWFLYRVPGMTGKS